MGPVSATTALGKISADYRTPALAILVFAVWPSLLVLGAAALTRLKLLPEDKDHFDILTDFAMFGAVIFETMAVTSIFVFRRQLPDAPRPYRCIGYPQAAHGSVGRRRLYRPGSRRLYFVFSFGERSR